MIKGRKGMSKGEINKIAVEGSIVVCNVHKFEFFFEICLGSSGSDIRKSFLLLGFIWKALFLTT